MADPAQPFILTLKLEPAAQARFDALRRELFPPERPVLPAHVTLFHQLPAAEAPTVMAVLGRAARRPPFEVTASRLVLLGQGVAFGIESDRLLALHKELAQAFAPWLRPQDRQGYRPHITVMNKVAPAMARTTHARLAAGFTPLRMEALGLLLWRYEGGPWSFEAELPFTGA